MLIDKCYPLNLQISFIIFAATSIDNSTNIDKTSTNIDNIDKTIDKINADHRCQCLLTFDVVYVSLKATRRDETILAQKKSCVIDSCEAPSISYR